MFSSAKNEEKVKNITTDVISSLKIRAQELEKQKANLATDEALYEKEDAELQAQIKMLENHRTLLKKSFNEKRSKVSEEENSLEKITKINLYLSNGGRDAAPVFKSSGKTIIKSCGAVPTGLPSEAKQALDNLADLLIMVARKFDLEMLYGEINLLDAQNIKITFSRGNYVARELEGMPAIRYFESLGLESCLDEDWGPAGGETITISSEKYPAAIKGLSLLADVSSSEIERRSHTRMRAMC
ncbi:MAG: hypothetical protein ACYCQI_07435 [Gammaproteobacteria bacterium]